jgi:hypothetical protein
MKIILACAIGGAMLLASSPGVLAKGGGRDTTVIYKDARTEFYQRYPGDEHIGSGTVRRSGPEQGPYIERCTWVPRDTFLGLPWGFQQFCRRYTLENTK